MKDWMLWGRPPYGSGPRDFSYEWMGDSGRFRIEYLQENVKSDEWSRRIHERVQLMLFYN